jgi:hypothetical protein
VKAGTVKVEALVDEVYAAISDVADVTPRDVRDAISGYGLTGRGDRRGEAQKRLAQIRTELRQLSTAEDVAAGKQLPRQDRVRQTQLRKQEADLARRLEQGDFVQPERQRPAYTRETLELQKQVEDIKARYNKELYRATRSRGGRITDELAQAANIPKTLKSMGDISAVLRQGGFYSVTHPLEGGVKPFRDMVESFTELGFRNVEARIKADPDFRVLRDEAKVDFTGVDKADPRLGKREEGYLGGEYIDYVPVLRNVKNFSERTFVSFLDAQRLYMGKQMLRDLHPQRPATPAELKAIGKLINIGTGRGSLGRRGNEAAPALNALLFSPRLLASRVQLLNNMVNPYTIAKMPPAVRRRMIKDNLKFVAAMSTALGLAKAAGAGVSLDPDDADFLKIRIGNSRYDTLTGLQQPLRFVYRMLAAMKASATDDETYAGEDKGRILERFVRTKESPLAAFVHDYFSGEDFQGRKFKLSREALETITPLYADDFYQVMKEEGWLNAAVKTAPSFVGIGAQTYKDSPEKPRTHAEKLSRKLVRKRMPDEAREAEQIEMDQKKAELRARSRKGEDVQAEADKLKLPRGQRKAIIEAKGRTRLQEDFKRLGLRDALVVYGTMDADERKSVQTLLKTKAENVNNLPDEQQEAMRDKLRKLNIPLPRPRRPRRESNAP